MTPRTRAGRLSAFIAVVALLLAGASFSDVGAGASPKAVFKQLGFNSYVQDQCQSTSVWASDASGQFKALKALGGNSIALAFPLYMTSITSDTVSAKHVCGTTYVTPSTTRLAVAIKEAHKLHLRVFLRPMIDETVLKAEGGWRGAIRPKNVSAWFRSYQAALAPYLKLAQQLKVEYFAISTELDSMATKKEWPSVISYAKRLYKGSLVFTCTWRPPGEAIHAGTSPGLDTYQAVALPPSATVAQLLASWNNAVASSNKVPFALSSTTIDELAINAQDGAYYEPWAWGLPPSDTFDQNIQANWYSMACSFFQSHNMQGLYFWGIWYVDGANAMPPTPNAGLAQEIQPASAAVIKACYTGK